MENILENLNKEQLDAAKTTKGALLILAGAGSGKTNIPGEGRVGADRFSSCSAGARGINDPLFNFSIHTFLSAN